MKKNLQIQEWLKSKEEKINEKLLQEEQERKAMEEAGKYPYYLHFFISQIKLKIFRIRKRKKAKGKSVKTKEEII